MLRMMSMSGLVLGLFLCGTLPSLAQFEFDPRFQVRLRGIVIDPNVKETIDPIGGFADVSTEWVPELDFTLFINDNIAFELIAAIAEHDIEVFDSAVGDLSIGDVLVLPPTLLAQYHFNFGQWRPYIGGGVNITGFFDEDVSAGGNGGIITDFNVETSFGPAAQFGVDYFITDNWLINADFKFIFIDADLTIDTVLGPVIADADINPLVFGVGIGYKF